MLKNLDVSNRTFSAPLKLVQALKIREINKYAWPEE